MHLKSNTQEVQRKLRHALEAVAFTFPEIKQGFPDNIAKTLTVDTVLQAQPEHRFLEYRDMEFRFKPEVIDRIVRKYGGDENTNPRIRDHASDSEFWNFRENIISSAGQLSAFGVTLPQYLVACAKNPDLFKEDNVYARISHAHEAFRTHNVTLQEVVKMHMGHANNFSLRPENKRQKFDDVVQAFKSIGLTPQQYLSAVLREPSLLANSSSKNIHNIQQIIDAYDDGRLTLKDKPASKQAGIEAWYGPIWNFICGTPALISLAPETLEHRLEATGDSRILFDPRETPARDGQANSGQASEGKSAKRVITERAAIKRAR